MNEHEEWQELGQQLRVDSVRAAAATNYVWKDTVLVRTGETVDILLDVTNPGRWMAHCHIAEHHESGMMFSFDVAAAKVGS